MDNLNQVIYYAIVLIMHGYANFEMIKHPHLSRSWLIHFSYLTHLGFYLNYIYYILRFICLFKVTKKIFRAFEDKVKSLFQFQYSISFVIAFSFWGMFFTNPLLLESKDIKIPIYCNITIHGLNYVFNLIEHTYMRPGSIINPFSKKWYLFIAAIYGTYTYYLYIAKGIILYNFITTNWTIRITMVVISCLLLFFSDWVYLNIHRLKQKIKI